MTPFSHQMRTQHSLRTSLILTGIDLAAGLLPLLLVAVMTWWLLDLPTNYLVKTITLYSLMAVLILRYLPVVLPNLGLGTANRVTLIRATFVLPITVLVLQPEVLRDADYWWIILLSAVAMIMDGVDGLISRRTGTSTAFGASFDMELDALLMLTLALLVWRSGQTGPWVILTGALRYLFVAASGVWPILQAQLPQSQRRKTICVVQEIALLICLWPTLPPTMPSLVAAGALVLLIYSFAVDIRWLLSPS